MLDFIGERPVSSFIHSAGRPISTSVIEVLRGPVETALPPGIGVDTAEDIDEGLVPAAHTLQGPLALADLIGLDAVTAVAESMYAEFKEPLYPRCWSE